MLPTFEFQSRSGDTSPQFTCCLAAADRLHQQVLAMVPRDPVDLVEVTTAPGRGIQRRVVARG